MDILISGPSYIFGDNISVINNATRHESELRKKSDSVCFHAICESVAMGETEYCIQNDIRDRNRYFVSKVFDDIYDY